MICQCNRFGRIKEPLVSVCVILLTVMMSVRVGFSETGPSTKGDWPQFLGPTRDLISSETRLLKEWPAEGPPLKWKAGGLGEGYSSVSISAGMIFTQGHFDGKEKIVALYEADGSLAWGLELGPALEVDRPGSRSTPTVDGEHVYVETVGGDVVCLNKSQGKQVWRKHLVKDFNGKRGNWGYAESPLVDGSHVICTPGGREATLVALDKRTGETVWKASVPEGDGASYSSAIVAELGGTRQYIQFLADGVVGIRASDGKYLWRENSSANSNRINCSSPVYHDGYVFAASGYGKGGALVRLVPELNGFTAKRVYHTIHMKSHHGGFFLRDGHIYGTNAAILTCLDFLTGKVAWRDHSVGKGAVVYADGHLYLRSEQGSVALAEVTPEGYREKGRFDQPHRSAKPAWAYPVIAGGRLYLRDQDILLCYDVRGDTAVSTATAGPTHSADTDGLLVNAVQSNR